MVSGSNSFGLIGDHFGLFDHLLHDPPVLVVLSDFFQSLKQQIARIHSHHQSVDLPHLKSEYKMKFVHTICLHNKVNHFHIPNIL